MAALGSTEATRPAPEAGELEDPRWVPWLLLLVALLPQLGAVLPLLSYYFRDFSIAFYPVRYFNAGELAAGRWTFWNPYLYEGTFVLPSFYPPDLLHVLSPTPAFVSWLLTLHFPLAALAAFALARDLGGTRWAGFVAGSLYSLGGLTLSSLNLYVYLQALALAPLVAVGLRRAALRGSRWIPIAAACLGLALSTLALEFVVQSVLLGLALAWVDAPRRRLAFARAGLACALGVGLAGLPLLTMLGLLQETVRGVGLPREIALANELHPLALVQALVPSLFGSLSAPSDAWWGGRFFTKGFPYFLSLYVGPQALALATAGSGAISGRRRRVLLGLAALGLWYALGERGGLASLLASWPVVRGFRFPSKGVLLPYLALAVLAGLGADRLRRGQGWRSAILAASGAASVGIVLGAALLAVPAPILAWMGVGPAMAPRAVGAVGADCARTALSALLLVGTGLLALRGRILATRAVALLVAVMLLELSHAGVGMNPQVPPSFYDAPAYVASERLADLEGGRVFSYPLELSPAFQGFTRRGVVDLGRWSFFLYRQTLGPYSNLLDRVETALAKELGSFLPRREDLHADDFDPRRPDRILPRLRHAAVSRVVSLDPLEHPELRLRTSVPAGSTGLTIHVYELARPWPRTYLACRVQPARSADEALAASLAQDFAANAVALESDQNAGCSRGQARRRLALPGLEVYEVAADAPGYLVTRDSYARGWRATLDGRPVPVLRANGKHRALPVAAGRHEVVLRYEPPALRAGIALLMAALVVGMLLWIRPALAEELRERGVSSVRELQR